MATLYAEAKQLKLHTGAEVSAFVRVEPSNGARPKCLLLHGNPRSLLDWEQLIPALTSAADIAAVDLPGFGRSARTSPEPEALNLDRLAEHTVAALDALGWREPITLIGHSHGGGVAQVVAARFPARVSLLALIGTLGAPTHTSYRLLALPGASVVMRTLGRLLRAQRLRRLNRAILRAVLVNIFAPDHVPTAKLEAHLALFAARPEILVSMVHVALGRPCAQLLQSAAEIRCPTLFIHGSKDALVPVNCAKSIHERIAEHGGVSQFHLLHGAGHMLMDQRAPEVAAIILEALREREIRDRN